MKYVEKYTVTQSVGDTLETNERAIKIDGVAQELESIPSWMKERIEGNQVTRTLKTD
jgi:hypothetical protein